MEGAKRICLVSPGGEVGEEISRSCRRRAALLATRHEVTLLYDDEPDAELADTAFSCQENRRSAAVLRALERAYGERGPDYVEVPDWGAAGLVPLQARRLGHPLLRDSLFAVRLVGGAAVRALHDGGHALPRAGLLADLEREQLRLADRLLSPGDGVPDLYRRLYPGPLPGAVTVREPFPLPAEAPPPASGAEPGPLRLLYLGPLQRHRGAIDLAEACLRLPRDDWALTMVGEDTATAPAGQSVRMTVETMFGADPRLAIEDPPRDGGLLGLAKDHDLVVVPPTLAAWPEAALAAMSLGLPVLATPVGGLPRIVADGETGWLTAGVGADAIRAALLDLLERREELERVRSSGAVRERLGRLADPQAALAEYERLLAATPAPATAGAPARPAAEPLVTGVIPYFRASSHVEEALDSLLGQTHRAVEAVIVNDGSFEPEDDVLLRLDADPRVRVVTQLNGGEGSARNLGACLARGEFLVMLDADNALEPEFVARALAAHACAPELAYVSCWLRFVGDDGSPVSDPGGYAALGNSVVRDDVENWDGDTLALWPRRLFEELGYGFDPAAVIHSDWELYRRLRGDRRFGAVIPEFLARYRVRQDSLQHAHGISMRRRGWQEALGRRRLRALDRAMGA